MNGFFIRKEVGGPCGRWSGKGIDSECRLLYECAGCDNAVFEVPKRGVLQITGFQKDLSWGSGYPVNFSNTRPIADRGNNTALAFGVRGGKGRRGVI